ncbi:DUF1629 domain-containing protein [Bradyrhizobium manausense]|nr:DUF1629 domain-containing protein [Bradyrhizobium manausense]
MAESSIEKRLGKSKAAKFYHVGMGGFHTALAVEIENIAVLNASGVLSASGVLMSPPGGRSFPPLPEPPRLLIDPSLGRAPADWELFDDFWLVSDRMKRVLETVDREGVAFLRCETRSLGRKPAPDYWLCDVIRILDAIDEEKSKGKILDDGTEYRRYDITATFSLAFKEEAVGSAHIFRPRFWGNIICDQVMKDACRGMRGIRFRDASVW